MEFTFPEGRTLTGITENTFRYQLTEDTDPSDYQVTIVYGSLNVTSRTEDARFEITVYGAKDHYVYDGTEHSTGGIRMEEDTPVRENTEEAEDVELYASEGQNFEINGVQYVLQGLSSSLTRSDAGTYPVPVTGTPVILDSSGNDVSDQFVVHTSPGEL